jgi:hypothetical protein
VEPPIALKGVILTDVFLPSADWLGGRKMEKINFLYLSPLKLLIK